MKEKNNMHILVTGGAGFIGSHIVDRLLKEGFYIRVLDNLSTGNIKNLNLSQVDFIHGDVTNEYDVAKAIKGINFVFHEAAQINPAKAVSDPIFDFQVNAWGTLNVLLQSLRAGVKRLIMASTNVYGNAPVEYMREDLSTLSIPKTLLSPYAAAKVAAEAYSKVANDELGLSTVRLRYFNVYGPRQLIKSESGVIAIFALNALSQRSLKIFGDGEQTRDFIYIDDVVEANILALKSKNASGKCYNVGTGIETSIREIANLIRELVGNNVPIEYHPARAADFKRAKADLALSTKDLGFCSKTSLRNGLKSYISWCRSNGEILK